MAYSISSWWSSGNLNKSKDEIRQSVIDKLPKNFESTLNMCGDKWVMERDLERFLIARDYDVDKTVTMIQNHIEWRQQISPNGKVKDDDLVDCWGTNFLYFSNACCKQGRPVITVVVKNNDPDVMSAEQVTRVSVLTLQRNADRADEVASSGGKMVSVYDMRGIGQKNLDFSHAKNMFTVMQDHFPERSSTLYCYEAPIIFWAFWKILSPFLAEKTRSKVKFIYGDVGIKELKEVIDENCLPEIFGGNAKLVNARETLKEEGYITTC